MLSEQSGGSKEKREWINTIFIIIGALSIPFGFLYTNHEMNLNREFEDNKNYFQDLKDFHDIRREFKDISTITYRVTTQNDIKNNKKILKRYNDDLIEGAKEVRDIQISQDNFRSVEPYKLANLTLETGYAVEEILENENEDTISDEAMDKIKSYYEQQRELADKYFKQEDVYDQKDLKKTEEIRSKH